jgi:hypothetical protein
MKADVLLAIWRNAILMPCSLKMEIKSNEKKELVSGKK